MPNLSDYAGQMLGNANRHREIAQAEAAEADPMTRSAAGKRHARGVPIVGPGSLGGVMDGTDPLQHVLQLEEDGKLWA